MPDQRYMDYALIPTIMHIAPHEFNLYPDAIQQELRINCLRLINTGWAGNPQTIKRD